MHLLFAYFTTNYKYCLGLHTATHVNTTTLLLFTFLLFIAIYDPGKPFPMGATFFGHPLYIYSFKCTYLSLVISSGAGRTIIGGANIHISLLTDCKNNRFQKKLITQNTNILIFAPPIIDLPAPLVISLG